MCSGAGLSTVNDQVFHQNTWGIPSHNEYDDRFGQSLTAGDFNGDGEDDLAIGAPGEDVWQLVNAGMITILYGFQGGLKAIGSTSWHQNTSGVEGGAEKDDFFGWSLTACDFNGDGEDDLAIGSYREDIGNINDAGAVNILYGSSGGITAVGDSIWHQNVYGVHETAEVNDYFGYSLTSGKFNGDGTCDLAVGVPSESIKIFSLITNNAGAVHVFYGSVLGITAAGNQVWSQNSFGIQDSSEFGDGFGRVLATGDFDGNGQDDLAVGVPWEDLNGVDNVGAVNVIYGTASGLTMTGNNFLYELDNFIIGDVFGASIAARR